MIDVVLMELEGVLADTAPLRQSALVGALAEEGVTLPRGALADVGGLAPRAAAEAALRRAGRTLDETGLELVALRAERAFAQQVGRGVLLAPGVRDFVESVHGRARLAIVTRAARTTADTVLALAGLEAAFEFVVAAEDVRDPKPDPTGYAKALARLARRRPVHLERAVALEDGMAGIAAAHAARLRCVVVGAEPYRAVEAEGYLPSLERETLESLSALVERGEEPVQ